MKVLQKLPVSALTLAILLCALVQVVAQPCENQPHQQSKHPASSGITHGPFVGHVTPTTAKIWARCKDLGTHRCTVEDLSTNTLVFSDADVTKEDDRCTVWKIENRLTLLGADQWQWLKQALNGSTAPFKILACGMIWNGAVRPNKTDYWMNYPHEREALFRFLGEERISGVVLVGGDIHRSRVLHHRKSATVGYDLFELITSPMHDGIIEKANAPHPDLLFDAGEPHSFLLLSVDTHSDPPQLAAELRNAAGDVLYEVRVESDSLAKSLEGSLRAP